MGFSRVQCIRGIKSALGYLSELVYVSNYFTIRSYRHLVDIDLHMSAWTNMFHIFYQMFYFCVRFNHTVCLCATSKVITLYFELPKIEFLPTCFSLNFSICKSAAEEIARIIILTILHTSQQHYHCQLVVHGQDSLRRGNTVYGNELAIFFFLM